jgi:hypothetical protein
MGEQPCHLQQPCGSKLMKAYFRIWSALVLVIPLVISGEAAWCQTTKTIKIVVPYAPGSGPDILSRLLAEQVGRQGGPPGGGHGHRNRIRGARRAGWQYGADRGAFLRHQSELEEGEL